MPQSSQSAFLVLKIALPLPLPGLFDYLPAEGSQLTDYQKGQRLLVPFGNRELVGILIAVDEAQAQTSEKLKRIISALEADASIPEELLAIASWAATYYHHPLGEVISSTLPLRYRQPEPRVDLGETVWVHTTEGLGLPVDALKRSKKQQKLHRLLLEQHSIRPGECEHFGISKAVCKAMEDRGLIQKKQLEPGISPDAESLLASAPLQLNLEQQRVLEQIRYHCYQCYLLEGVTGSGKTEVYMQVIARVLQAGQQALVLIPEIGLTPQTLARFHERFRVDIAELHSRVSKLERARNWEKARSGQARIIIGTRLAALAPLHKPGVIIVDEEHDTSYKQQENFRYSARDISIYRAHKHNIPIILGSATPSLESLHNAISGRYQHLKLNARAGNARPPQMLPIDMRSQKLEAGITAQAFTEISSCLAKGKQALVFLNRRGYAPLLFCPDCGWNARCPSCELNLTLHQKPPRLHCHHCDFRRAVPTRCPDCQSGELQHSGAGTEQIVEVLRAHFERTPIIRIDRDTTRNKDGFASLLDEARRGEPCILVGTQMLAKGHHLKDLHLVLIMDTDQGLMSPDYKAVERLGQLVTQVAGRAGRESTQGTVLLQSLQPEHPLLQTLIHQGYPAFAQALLQTRQAAALPPYTYSALFRAESKRGENAVELLAFVKQELRNLQGRTHGITILGPFPAIIEKLNHRYRYQLQLYARNRKDLHALLQRCLPAIYQNALARRARWSLDIDPYEHI